MRLSPHDTQIFNKQAAMALAHFFAGHHAEASSWAENAVRGQPRHLMALCAAAASAALMERAVEAQKVIARLHQIDPVLSTAHLENVLPLRRPEDRAKFAEALRKAGLPE
jgi:hypothetical protein